MKRKNGEVTHLTLGEYITMYRLPELDLGTAAKIKTEAKILCDQSGKMAIRKMGTGIRHGIVTYLYPYEIIEQAYDNVLRNSK